MDITSTILSESGLLFVSKIYCLHSSNETTSNYNWLWKVEPTIISRGPRSTEVGKIVRLINTINLRTKALNIKSIYVVPEEVFDETPLVAYHWPKGISTLSTVKQLAEQITKSISDGLKILKELYKGMEWWDVLLRKGSAYSDILRAAVIFTNKSFPEPLNSTVDATIDEALRIVEDEYRFDEWFNILYGKPQRLLGCVNFVDSLINSKLDPIKLSGCKLPVIITNEGVVGLYGKMQHAVEFVNKLDQDYFCNEDSEMSHKIKYIFNKRPNSISSFDIKVKLNCKSQKILERKYERHCLAQKNIRFYSAMKSGVAKKICSFIEYYITPIFHWAILILPIIAFILSEKLVGVIFNCFRFVLTYFPNTSSTLLGIVVPIVQASCIIIFLIVVIKFIKSAISVHNKILLGRLSPSCLEKILLLLDSRRHINWLVKMN